jgi:cell division protein FtsL
MNATLRRTGPWLLIGVAVLVLATAQVALAHQRLETAGRYNQLQHDVRQAGDEISRLKIELAMLTRPERLRAVALDQLGMHPPTAAQVINP